MSGFDYLMDQGQRLAPARFTANNFSDLCKAILSKRAQISITDGMTDEARKAEKQKLYWFSAATQQDGQRRKPENMAACAFSMLDIDGSSPGAITALSPVFRQHSLLVYQTASHTAEEPRLRIVCELSSPVESDGRRPVSESVETMLMQAAGFTLVSLADKKARWESGGDYAIFDRNVYGAQSYCYCPHVGAKAQTYTGAVIDVDALPAPEQPPAKVVKSKAKKQAQRDAAAVIDADFDDLTAGPDTFIIADIRSALWYPAMLQKAYDNGAWIDQGYRLASLKGTDFEDDARQMWIDWSVTAQDAYEEDLSEVAAQRWDGLEPDKTSYKAIFADAQALGWNNPGKWRAKAAYIEKMAPSTRGELLAQYYGNVCLKADGNMVYRYTGQGWEHVADAELRRQLSQIFKDNGVPFTPYEIRSAIEAMGMLLPLMGETPRNLIGFANGVYDLEAQQFRPHHPGDWLTGHNGVEYTQPVKGETLKNNAPNFWRWLHHSAGGDRDKIGRIKAALYMVLANRYDWQLFIEVTGAGGSGKSVLTGIARMLTGEQHATSGTMEDMDTARERASFVGKSLITLPDQATYTGSGPGIKAITGGDVVRIDPKHEKPFHTVIRAVVIATNNEPMRFTERQGGISRRRVIFPFNQEVPETERDPHLLDKIKAELPVIVRGLLTDFEQAGTAKTLLIAQRDSAEALQVKNDNDPMYGFCSFLLGLPNPDGMYMGNGRMGRAPRIYLYHAYLEYLEAHGYQRTPTLNKFSGELRDTLKAFGVVLEKRPTKKGFRYNVNLSGNAEEWLGEDDLSPVPETL
ncbi:DNA primase [Salmonella enterica]|nr:DNA primase [Salmonella enterica]ECU9527510.1 DNA primase [Salmonella enterica subsp. enterica serovar Sandiego]EAV5341018.1 DNA primase [Salmonella enterica]EBL9676842.1 DNA primase [Salmonella enterica]EBM5550852.1 DNA primase [Salmonella enterica]